MTTALTLFSVNAFADSYKKRIYSERAKHNALPFRCSKLDYYQQYQYAPNLTQAELLVVSLLMPCMDWLSGLT